MVCGSWNARVVQMAKRIFNFPSDQVGQFNSFSPALSSDHPKFRPAIPLKSVHVVMLLSQLGTLFFTFCGYCQQRLLLIATSVSIDDS
jgi:hypothetical protein